MNFQVKFHRYRQSDEHTCIHTSYIQRYTQHRPAQTSTCQYCTYVYCTHMYIYIYICVPDKGVYPCMSILKGKKDKQFIFGVPFFQTNPYAYACKYNHHVCRLHPNSALPGHASQSATLAAIAAAHPAICAHHGTAWLPTES